MTRLRPAVCVIEDDDDIREVIAEVLMDRGYEVLSAVDGASALECLHACRTPCCLILLDLMMAGMNGWEFRRQQLADPTLASIPVVLMTGAGNPVRADEQLGTAGALEKPLDLDELLTRVSSFCDLART
jgi:CheY-like chemotaxis protein